MFLPAYKMNFCLPVSQNSSVGVTAMLLAEQTWNSALIPSRGLVGVIIHTQTHTHTQLQQYIK
jgi:hypothetical protein